jgi:NAD(P)-dependent dehydrogenase (short-subunit alcohol dehydrogenase family)
VISQIKNEDQVYSDQSVTETIASVQAASRIDVRLKAFGIRVSIVEPGIIDTPMFNARPKKAKVAVRGSETPPQER